MNIDWMCLLKAIGMWVLLLAALFLALSALVWVGERIASWWDTVMVEWLAVSAEVVGVVFGLIMIITLLLVIPIHAIYESICP